MLRGDSGTHLSRVLRARPGQLYELSDGEAVWLGRVEQVRRDAVVFELIEDVRAPESLLEIALLLSIIKFDRFEWCLEKATELGAGEIIPLAAARSEKALVVAARKRAERWRRILIESGQQSRRLRPPVLVGSMSPAEAFDKSEAAIKLFLSEGKEAGSLREILSKRGETSEARRTVVIAIGPEGGWTEVEREAAGGAGFTEVSLGPNILRTETAVIAAMAIVNYALGESGRFI